MTGLFDLVKHAKKIVLEITLAGIAPTTSQIFQLRPAIQFVEIDTKSLAKKDAMTITSMMAEDVKQIALQQEKAGTAQHDSQTAQHIALKFAMMGFSWARKLVMITFQTGGVVQTA